VDWPWGSWPWQTALYSQGSNPYKSEGLSM